MDISIVVPVHNEERLIEGCIRSLLELDYPRDRYEIIVVDNNSTDRSREIVRRFPRVKLLREPEQGDFAARNRGLRESRGEIIAFTDSDTAPFRDWLKQIREAMRPPEVAVVIGNLQFHPDSKALEMMADYEAEKAEFIFSSDVKEIYFGYTCNMIVRRSAFDKLGPFARVYRNADVVFVRKAVDEFSCDAVRYGPKVRVRRLEVSSLWTYFAKQAIYGRDFQRYGQLAAARPLNNRERLQIYRQAVRRMGYSPVKAAGLFGLLSVGAVSYELARWRASRNGHSGH
jgi:glycosyltransferase involved in cell wall biosynthesis